jgi:tRNA U54 and U55 pseudouridine synthase Pus10
MKFDKDAVMRQTLEALVKQVDAKLLAAGLRTSKAKIVGSGRDLRVEVSGPKATAEKAQEILKSLTK